MVQLFPIKSTQVRGIIDSRGEPIIRADDLCCSLEIGKPEWMSPLVRMSDLLALAIEMPTKQQGFEVLRIAGDLAGGMRGGPLDVFYKLYGAAAMQVTLGCEMEERCAPRQGESEVSRRLAIAVQGKCEVGTPSGRIDVLTNTQIIEVKKARSWRTALGQVLDYSPHYPNHTCRIHLFAVPENFNFQRVLAACSAVDVVVTWEDEDDR